MADGEGVDIPGSLCQSGSDGEDEDEKSLTSLMERLRSKEKIHTSRSWQDTCKLWKHSITDKRPSDTEDKTVIHNQLASLSKAVRVGSVSSLVEHLEQCGRKAGLTLVTCTGANKVILKADMYEVQVFMDNTAQVKDVIITHDAVSHRDPQSPEELARPVLTQLICTNHFGELTRHLEGLSSMFSISGDRAQKTKAFIALQSLETDLNMLSKMQSTISSVANYIHKSPLGILQPRVGGLPMQMTYFVGPYDLLCPLSHSFCPMTVEAIVAQKVGYRVSVGVQPSAPHTLQTMPLIMDGKSIPSFSAMNKINSCTLPAVFVLRLHQKLPLSWSLIQRITATTGVEFVDRRQLQSLMSLIIQHVRKKHFPDGGGKHGLHVHLPDQRHSYFLHPWPGGTDPEGAVVSEIPFTHPTHVAAILNYLRQQVLFNTLVASCVRNASLSSGDECWTFELVPGSLTLVTISFEHPFSDSIATVEVDLTDMTTVKCHVVVDKDVPESSSESTFCTDETATKVLQRCLSLPVTLRWILHQALSQIQHKLRLPSPQVDSATSPTHPNVSLAGSLLDASGSNVLSRTGQERRQAFIDAHARSQLPWKHMNNLVGMYSSTAVVEIFRHSQVAPPPIPMETTLEPIVEENFDSFAIIKTEIDNIDKVSRNPMLASLLGQDTKSPHQSQAAEGSPSTSSTGSGNHAQQSMLSALLGDSSSPQQQQQQLPLPMIQQQQQQKREQHQQQMPPALPLQQQREQQQQQQLMQQQQQREQQLLLQQQQRDQQLQQQREQQQQHQREQQQQQQQQQHIPQPPHQSPHHPQYPPPILQTQPVNERQKKRGKRKSIGERMGEVVAGRGPKRKASEDDLRRETLFNVDGSSSSSMETVRTSPVKTSPVRTSPAKASPTKMSPLVVAGQGDSSRGGLATGPGQTAVSRVSESHVNKLASTVDSIIRHESNVFPLPTNPPCPAAITSQDSQHKETKRFKSESDTLSAELPKNISPVVNIKIARSMSDSDGAFTNNRLPLKTIVKLEKTDPFDFSATVSSSKDSKVDIGLMSGGRTVVKQELGRPGLPKEASSRSSKEKILHNAKPVVTSKVDIMDHKPDTSVRWKEKRREKREQKDNVFLEEKPEFKEKPPAITVKLNTRDLTARTIIKESPRHSSSPQDVVETNAKKESSNKLKMPMLNTATIDLTVEGESDKSNASTPSQGRVTPGLTPATSPRLLPPNLKREGKEKVRGEKRRHSSKHNAETDDSERKHKKHNDESRKELKNKQRIYDFEADVNEADSYRVEKVVKPTTIKIRAGKVLTHSGLALPSKISPVSPVGNKSPSVVSKPVGVASPSIKIVKSGDGSKSVVTMGSVTKQRASGSQRTYARSKSEAAPAQNNPGSGGNKELDTKLCKTPTIKLKPLNLPTSASVTVPPAATTAGYKTPQAPASAPITLTNKPSPSPSSTSSNATNTNAAHKPAKPNKSKKLLAVIDKLKKQQVASPSGVEDSREADPPKNQKAIYDAIRLEIIRAGNKPSTPSKDQLPSTLKSSHIKKIDPSTKSETFKKSDFNKSGAMPSVNTSLGVIPKTATSQGSKQHNAGGQGSTNKLNTPATTTAAHKAVTTDGSRSQDSSGVRKDMNAIHSKGPPLSNNKSDLSKPDPHAQSKPTTHNKLTNEVPPHLSKNESDPKHRAEGSISSRDPRNVLQTNSRSASPVCAPGIKDSTSRTGTPPLNKTSKLDDTSDKSQKGPRHFLDAVKIPVNGKAKGGLPGAGKDNAVIDPNSEPEKHPNHEIFTENPSSPTDEVEEEISDLRLAAFSHKSTPEARVSPVLDGCTSVQSRNSPLLENCRTVTSRSSPVLDSKSNCSSPGIPDGSKSCQDRIKRVHSDAMSRNSDLGLPKPSAGHNCEKRVNLDVSEDTSFHNAWKRNLTGSSVCNPSIGVSDKVSIPRDSVSVNRTSSPGARAAILAAAKDDRVSPLCSDVQSKRPMVNAGSVKHTKSIASCPSSPVSSPEDGLIIDFPSSPKSVQSPGRHLVAPPSVPVNHSVNSSSSSSIVIHHATMATSLTDGHQHQKTTSPQRRPIKNLVTTPKSLMNSVDSPDSFHASPVEIDDDLMDEALIL